MESPLVRFATSSDLPHVASCLRDLGGPEFLARLGAHTPLQYYQWKYYGNPAGEAIVGIAVTNDRVVGTIAATPTPVQIGPRRCAGFLLGDFYTSPLYRRRGLFSTLLTMVSDEAQRRGADLLYVQPNGQSAPLLARQDFTLPVRLREHMHIIPSTTLRHKLRVPQSVSRLMRLDGVARWWSAIADTPGVSVSLVDRFEPVVQSFWEHARLRYAFLPVRDIARLNWRYADCPAPYRLFVAERDGVAGIAVVSHSHASGLATLAELLTNPFDPDVTNALLRAALVDSAEAGLQRLYAWAVDGAGRTKVDDAVRRVCPIARREPVRVAVRVLNPSLELPSRDWRLGPGDFDGV